MAARRHTTLLRVTATGYEPTEEDGIKQHAKLKLGMTVGADIARGRSVVQNALYWKVLTVVVAHCPGRWRTAEALHEVLKVGTGHVEIVQLIDGRLIKIPQSTAFDAMKQNQFQVYLDAAFRIIEDEILGGVSIDELLANTGYRRPDAPPTDDADTDAAEYDPTWIDSVCKGLSRLEGNDWQTAFMMATNHVSTAGDLAMIQAHPEVKERLRNGAPELRSQIDAALKAASARLGNVGGDGAVEGHHQEGDRIGWVSFERKYDTDLRALAIRLAEQSPHIKQRTGANG
jgi:hypothetical protein